MRDEHYGLCLQGDAAVNSPVKKRSIVIGHHKTSISLEDDFWTSLRQIAHSRQVTISDLIASLDAVRENSNLSSAIRVFILDHYSAMAGQSRGSSERQTASVS
jgi:predicted DNA-binding ribbon-helix-helix protein